MSKFRYRDMDLADLKNEIRNAYVKKVLECQIREKEAEREIAKIREEFMSNSEKLKIREFKDELRNREKELVKKREMYRRELEDQMKDKEFQKKVVEEEEKRERKELEEGDRIVEEQDFVKKFTEKRELAERLNRERTIFQEIKNIRKRAEADAEEKATKRNEKYLEELARRTEELKILEEKQKKRREELINKVAKMFVNFDEKKMEKESKIAKLAAEEIAWDLVIQEREDELRRKKMREELAEGLRDQIIFTTECARRSLERDRIFAETVMRRIMEDEKIEKLTNEAKIRSRIRYKEDLTRMMAERDKMRKNEILRIREELEMERKVEEIRKEEIREARKKLLIEHAENVASYVECNLLTNEEKNIITNALKK